MLYMLVRWPLPICYRPELAATWNGYCMLLDKIWLCEISSILNENRM